MTSRNSDLNSRHLTVQTLTMLCLFWLSGQALSDGLQPYDAFLQSPKLSIQELGGKNHDLLKYRGQVVLINFWATWCPPCIVEMPALQRLKQKLAGKPFRILAVNEKESEETIWKFHKLVKVDFPLLLDRDGQASEDWHVSIYPSSYLVDAAGEIRYQVTGMLEWDAPEVVEVIEALMVEDIRDREPAGAPPPAR